jgi:hypothetical protein
MNTKSIRLEYARINMEELGRLIIADAHKTHESREIRLGLLARIGVTVEDDESPLDAWYKHLCRINGIEYRQPLPKSIRHAIAEDEHALVMMCVLTQGSSK